MVVWFQFYQHYKRKHGIADIHKEEQKMLEYRTFSADTGLGYQKTKKVCTILRTVIEVMKLPFYSIHTILI